MPIGGQVVTFAFRGPQDTRIDLRAAPIGLLRLTFCYRG